jgi:hypothetical protein
MGGVLTGIDTPEPAGTPPGWLGTPVPAGLPVPVPPPAPAPKLCPYCMIETTWVPAEITPPTTAPKVYHRAMSILMPCSRMLFEYIVMACVRMARADVDINNPGIMMRLNCTFVLRTARLIEL